jgi:transposase
MTRRRKDRLRAFTAAEQAALEQLTRARSAPHAQVTRAKVLLAVASGDSYQLAAYTAGCGSRHTVAGLVARFNAQGLAALDPPHSGGPTPLYTPAERARILAEARRPPDREQDGTATWSLRTLQRALQRAPDGLPHVSRYTLWVVLRDAGWHWQRHRSWCPTGTALRKRKTGIVTVHDPDTTPKKT